MRSGIALVALALIPASCGSGPGPATTGADPFAVIAEADRLAARDLWPGFAPTTIPVAIYDGEQTLLFRHPGPPEEFSRVPDRDGVWTYAGRHPSVVANTSTELAGVRTATLMPAASQAALQARAGILIHELFHVFQRERHPGWSANEAEFFTYPVDDAAQLALRRLETEALRRALAVNDPDEVACWTGTALELRRDRFALLPAGAVGYERGTELNEGLAAYVEHRATGAPDQTILPPEDFAPDAIRTRGYRTGVALARLLDRLSPAWRDTLEANDGTALDLLLAAAYDTVSTGDAEASSTSAAISTASAAASTTPAAAPTASAASAAHTARRAGCDFTPAELERARAAADKDVAALRSRREDARRSFLDRGGWTLVVDASDTPLFPQGFDPLNVQVVAPGEVLHARYVKVGNESNVVEVIGVAALTEAAGPHPLFNGVRSLTITGLEEEPQIETTAGVATLAAPGISATLPGATAERHGRTITLRLRP